jgi:hypothetical protein
MIMGWVIIDKGWGGWHAMGRGGNSSTLELNAGDDYLSELAKDGEEGALVYDASQADMAQYIRLVCTGPSVGVNLPFRSCQELDSQDIISYDKHKPSRRLDYVSVDVYREMLSKISGVRLGHIESGRVVWE